VLYISSAGKIIVIAMPQSSTEIIYGLEGGDYRARV